MAPQVGCIVLDAVGTAGGSGTAFILSPMTTLSQQYYLNALNI
jgi:hypothetical protein